MGNPTIKDVAKLAGVSIATVSRVLNQNNSVKPDLVEKVNSAIEDLGYYPNSIARTLKSESSKTIAFIVSDISNDFFTSMARSIEDVLNQHGYSLIVCSTDDNKEREANYLQLLREKLVDGYIINTSGKNDELISKLSQTSPFVLFSRKITTPTFKGDFIDNNNYESMYNLTKHLLSKGHRKIGLINGQSFLSTSQERQAGFVAAMKDEGILVDDNYPFFYHGHFSRISSGAHGIEKLLSAEEKPTAVICANNLLVTGALQYCMERNISIPDEISLCSFGSISNSSLLKVSPTCVRQLSTSMSLRIADMIMERIDAKNELVNREVRFETTLIEGNSVKCIL